MGACPVTNVDVNSAEPAAEALRARLLEQGVVRLWPPLAAPVGATAALAAEAGLGLELEQEQPGYRSYRLHYAGHRPEDPGVRALDALAARVAAEGFGARSQATLQLTETLGTGGATTREIMGPHVDGYADRVRPLLALLAVLLTPHEGEAGFFVVPGSVAILSGALDPGFRAQPPDAAALSDAINAAVPRVLGSGAPRRFLAGPAGSVFLLHPLAAHGVLRPSGDALQRRAFMRLYPAGLSLRDSAACEAHARRVAYPFGGWEQALERLPALGALPD